jgi:hypothetical protein
LTAGHSQQCRLRIEALLKNTSEGRERLGRFEARFAHYAEKKMRLETTSAAPSGEVELDPAERELKRIRAGKFAASSSSASAAASAPPDPPLGARPAVDPAVVAVGSLPASTPSAQSVEMKVDRPPDVIPTAKRGSDDLEGSSATKRGRTTDELAQGPGEAPRSSSDDLETGALVPALGLEILRCDEDDEDDTVKMIAVFDVDSDGVRKNFIDQTHDWEASDDVKGGALDPTKVMEARSKELEHLRGQGVYEYATKAEAMARTGKAPIRLKWIDSNKGDSENPKCRSRLVCTEIRRKGMVPIFSATPPLEAIRVLVAKLSSEDPSTTKDPLKAMLVDVSRAHFCAPAVREVFIELPREDPRRGDGVTCGRLLKTVHGTLDAAEQWGLHYTRTLVDAGFVQGWAWPCLFLHPRFDIWVVVHGDDFLVVARGAGRQYFEKIIRAAYEVKISIAGPSAGTRENSGSWAAYSPSCRIASLWRRILVCTSRWSGCWDSVGRRPWAPRGAVRGRTRRA